MNPLRIRHRGEHSLYDVPDSQNLSLNGRNDALVELLIVMAIIAVMAVLSLSQAKKRLAVRKVSPAHRAPVKPSITRSNSLARSIQKQAAFI